MPLHDYLCPNGHLMEDVLTGVDADTHLPCPECDEQAEKQPGVASIRFKGLGFHETDYKVKEKTEGYMEMVDSGDGKLEYRHADKIQKKFKKEV